MLLVRTCFSVGLGASGIIRNSSSLEENGIDRQEQSVLITDLVEAAGILEFQLIHELDNLRKAGLRLVQRHERNLQYGRLRFQKRSLSALDHASLVTLHIHFDQNIGLQAIREATHRAIEGFGNYLDGGFGLGLRVIMLALSGGFEKRRRAGVSVVLYHF